MTTTELIEKLNHLGVKLSLAGDKLQVNAPAGVLTPELKAAILDLKPALQAELKGQQAKALDYQSDAVKIKHLLRQQSWAVIQSQMLDEAVVWVCNDTVKVPDAWSGCVRYTLDELQALSTGPKVDAAGLRMIHESKRLFDGQVCSNA